MAYWHFAQDSGIRHAFVNVRAGERARGAIQIPNEYGWHARFKGWLRRLIAVTDAAEVIVSLRSTRDKNFTGQPCVIDQSVSPKTRRCLDCYGSEVRRQNTRLSIDTHRRQSL